MRRARAFAFAAIVAMPVAAFGQANTTQSRDGLGSASHPVDPSNSHPAGGVNAATGPQAHPAYPSGSTTPNPGAAMVRANSPKPATGPAKSSPGSVKTTTVGRSGSVPAGGPGVGEAPSPPK